MSGHSKWHTIKHAKGIADAKRGQLFTKLTREIIIAAREGGGNPEGNFRLRLAIQKARDANMPMENIDRAIKKGTGEIEGGALDEMVLEGYGPNGIAIMVNALSDNRNRTIQEVRSTFVRGGGSLGESGCVAWLFDSKGIITIKPENVNADDLALAAIDAGAEDVKVESDYVEVYTTPDTLEKVRAALESQNVAVESSELQMVPKSMVQLEDKAALQTLKLLEKLEEIDDVQNVYHQRRHPGLRGRRLPGLIDFYHVKWKLLTRPRERILQMKILGIDPGTVVMGYGLIESEGENLAPVDFGAITVPELPGIGERLNFLYKNLVEIIRRNRPDAVAVEQPFIAKNVRSAMSIGRAQAVALLAAAGEGIPAFEYTPAQVKLRVANYGASGKEQIQEMVRLLLGLAQVPEPNDAADALAVAICHVQEMHLNDLLARQGG